MSTDENYGTHNQERIEQADGTILPKRFAAFLAVLFCFLMAAAPGQAGGGDQGQDRDHDGHRKHNGHGHSRFNQRGNLLIADQFNNRVIEVDPAGDIVWSFGLGPADLSPESIIGCNDAERVGKFTLMAGSGLAPGADLQVPAGAVDNRVILVNEHGRIAWQYGQFQQTGSGFNLLNTPVQAVWLPNAHVLITDQGNNRIIEVTLRKQIVWQYPGSNTNAPDQLNSPNSAELLENATSSSPTKIITGPSRSRATIE